MKTFKEFIEESRNFTGRMKRERIAARRPSQDDTIERERGEFERYPNSAELMHRARTAHVRNLTRQEVSRLTNSDAPNIKPGAKGRRKVRRLAKEHGRDLNRVKQQVKQGTNEPLIVHKGELIAGNTRGMHLSSIGKPIEAVVIP